MGRSFPSTGAVCLRGSVVLSVMTAGASASPVLYDSVLRNCSNAAQVIAQGVIVKDEHTFIDGTLGVWDAMALSHLDPMFGADELTAYSEQHSWVLPDSISFTGEARLAGTSIMTPALSADAFASTFLTVFFTVSEPVAYEREVLGPVSGLFLHEEAPFAEISEPTGLLSPGKYSISAAVALRLDDDGASSRYGRMTLRFLPAPGPGAPGLAVVVALAGAARRRRSM